MNIEPPSRILVVRRDNIGDLICTTPLIAALRQQFPDAYLAVLANSYNRAVLDGNPAIDEIFSYDKLKHTHGVTGRIAAVIARIKLIMAMRAKRFDLAILAKSGFDRHGLRLARQAGVKAVLGFAPEQGTAPDALTHPIAAENPKTLHEVEVVGQLLRPLGGKGAPGPLKMFPDARLVSGFRQKLEAQGPGRKWIALHLSAREQTRRWPEEKFVALIEQLNAVNDRPDGKDRIGFVLLWSPGAADNPTHPGDDDKAAEVLRRSTGACVVPITTVRLQELIAAVAACDLFVGADGGAMHVAVGLGLPVAALFENSDAKRLHWYPWQVSHRLIQPTMFPVSDIGVDAVASAVVELLPDVAERNAG